MKSIKKYWLEYRLVLICFLVWRVGLFAIGYIAISSLPFKKSFPYIFDLLSSKGYPQWLWHFGNFDGVHYLDIAGRGYHSIGSQVFFPLFPILIRVFSFFDTRHILLSGLLVSNFAFLLSAICFYHLAKKTFDKKIASWATLFLFAFPTSFFFGSIYSESVFFLVTLLAFATKGAVSVIFSIYAGLSRLIGAAVPFALLFQRGRNWFYLFGFIGTLFYILFLKFYFNSPLYFISGQSLFRNERSSDITHLVTPFQTTYRYIKIFLTVDISSFAFFVAGIELVAFIAGIVILFNLTFRRKIPIEWMIYSWIALLIPSFTGTFTSMPRYLMTIFPIYIYLAMIKNTKTRIVILMLFIVLLGLFTAFFARGYFIS